MRKLIATAILSLLILQSFSFAQATSYYNLTYDGNGNLVTGDGKYREYNGFNQLIRVRTGNNSNGSILEEYIYHPTDDRIIVKKTNFEPGNSPDEMVVYVDDNFVRTYNPQVTTGWENDTYYAKDENGLVGEMVTNQTITKKLYYSTDHLGSTSVITNDSGGVVEKTFYDPYGQILSGGNISRYQYEGREFSSFTDDYDFRFRKYDPTLGIFTQPEQLFPNLYDPQQLNRYSFERRNPYKYVDSTGKFVDTVMDANFIVYDISQLTSSEGVRDWVNWASLVADVGCIMVPYVTLGGVAVRGGAELLEGVSKVDKVIDASKLSTRAEEIMAQQGGKILPYKDAKKFTEGLGGELQAHKLFEKRQTIGLGMSKEAIFDTPSMILPRQEHQTITNLLRNDISYSSRSSQSVSSKGISDIMSSYRKTYSKTTQNSKGILSAIQGWFSKWR